MIKKLLLFFSLGLFTAGSLYAQPAGWAHRLDLRVTNENETSAEEFQVLVKINTQALIQAGKMKSDGSDIRFGADAQGSVFLPYFIEHGINTTETRIWVKLDKVPANGRKNFFLFYGNPAASGATTVEIFIGPHSATDSVSNGGPGGIGNSQRGFRFAPTEDIFVTKFGKREPNGTDRYVTLFDFQSEAKLEQIQVAGPAAQYSYANVNQAFWLQKDREYVLQLYQNTNDGYYFGSSLAAGQHIRFIDMRYCNSCDQNTFPTNTLQGMHYGYPDLHYYTRNQTIPLMQVEIGPFVGIDPATLPHGKVNDIYEQQLTGMEGTAPYTFALTEGNLPTGLSLTQEGKLSGTPTAGGTYNFTITVTDGSPDGGKIGTRAYSLVVDRADQLLTFTAPANKTYGDQPFKLEASSSVQLPVLFNLVSGPATINGNELTITGAGEVTVKATQAGNTDYNQAEPVTHSFTVAKKAVTVAADDQTRTYGEENKPFTFMYDGLVNEETSIAGITATTSVDEGSAPGEYAIVPDGSADNYQITFINGKLTVKPKAISVSLISTPLISKEYDGKKDIMLSENNYQLTGVIRNDEVMISAGEGLFENEQAGAEKTVTAVKFVLKGAAKDNYHVVTESAATTGKIYQKAITLSLNVSPAIVKEYDGSDMAMLKAENYKLNGLIEGDMVSVTGMGHYNDKNAGADKTITVNNLSLEGEAKRNYVLETSSISTTGSISRKPVSISFKPGSSVVKTYDGNAIASFTNAVDYVISGLVGEDEVAYTKPVAGIFADKNAGEQKEVTVSGLEVSGAGSNNYTLTTTTITANIGTINKKNVSVVAEGKTKVYGTPDPDLTYSVTGMVGNETLDGQLQRTTGKNVGEYPINEGSLSGGANYSISSYTAAAFRITPAALMITAQDKTKKQGDVNPVFTLTYSGLAEGDEPSALTVAPKVSTEAATGSPIGYYPITVSGASSPNYSITYTTGKLTINPSGNSNVKAWSSSPDMLQLRIYAEQSQKSNIILFTDRGQRVVAQAQQLNPGITSATVYVGRLAPGIYVLNVTGENFKDVQMIRIK